MPDPVPATSPFSQFSEERAMTNLYNLTSLGPRIDGMPTQNATQQWILDKIQQIRPLTNVKMEIDRQDNPDTYTGRFISNLFVKLSSGQPENNTLLISSHYDTTEFSFGGSDDGTGVVTMLELISNIVNADNNLSYPIIFMFSDGEESRMRGSKLFRYHKWYSTTTRFINLDSTGGSGKAIMFRLSPTSLINEYAQVPHPHTTVIGEEIMKFVPSDTDFTSFVNSGISGFDFAFYQKGYAYHTWNDKAAVVERGGLQHLGDNVMFMINAHQSSQKRGSVDGNYVYYDVFGLFLVSYDFMTGVYIHIGLIVASVFIVFFILIVDHIVIVRVNLSQSIYQYFPKHHFLALFMRFIIIVIYAIGYIFSMVGGILLSLLISLILASINPYSWFAQPSLGIFTFGFFCVVGMILIQSVIHYIIHEIVNCRCCKTRRRTAKSEIEKNGETMSQFLTLSLGDERHMALLLVYAALQIAVCSAGLRSLYLVLIWSIFIVPPIALSLLIEHIISWIQLLILYRRSNQVTSDYVAVTNTQLEPLENLHRRTSSVSMIHPPLERDIETADELAERVTFLAEMENMYEGVVQQNDQTTMYYSLTGEQSIPVIDRVRSLLHTSVRHQVFWCIVPYVSAVIPMAFSIDILIRYIYSVHDG
jgi:hypothetical protein